MDHYSGNGHFVAHPASAHMVRQRFQQHGLSVQQSLLQLSLTMQHRDGNSSAPNAKDRYRKWHNVVLSDEFQFCMQYSDTHIRIWRLQRECLSPACIWYQHRVPAPGMIVWAAIGYMTYTFLVQTDGILNENWYIFNILCWHFDILIVPCLPTR